MGSVAAIPQVVEERVVFYHQRAAHFYRTLGYFIGNVIVDIPFSIIETIIFTCLVFWMTGMYKGLHEPFISYCVYALVLFLTSMIAKQFARFCAASTPTLGFASSIAPAMLCVWLVFAGFLIPRSSIEWYWSWMNILSPFRYTFESLAINQLNDLSFYCSAGELVPPNTNATTPPYFGQQVRLISECCVSIETYHSALSLSLCVDRSAQFNLVLRYWLVNLDCTTKTSGFGSIRPYCSASTCSFALQPTVAWHSSSSSPRALRLQQRSISMERLSSRNRAVSQRHSWAATSTRQWCTWDRQCRRSKCAP